MKKNTMYHINSISEFHKKTSLPKPQNPLVSLVDYGKVVYQTENDSNSISWVQDFYSIGLKRNINGKFRYGQQPYDFDEGLMSFVAPGQLIHFDVIQQEYPPSGWVLLVHPDFLWSTPLAKNIREYEFFGYEVNEALFLSEKEEMIIVNVMRNIEQEYHSNIDKFSQNIIIAQIEVLLNYAERFFQRQFITRKITNHEILGKLENFLKGYFDGEVLVDKGLPSVQDIALNLNVSPNYLSGLLKNLTGQNTQQHIHEKLIEKAKEKLSTTNLSVGEIAYQLGFEHPQSFSRLFKTKSGFTPVKFRASFN